MTKRDGITVCPTALANGAYGKDSIHCRRSLDIAAGKCVPQFLPGADLIAATPKKATPATPKGKKLVAGKRLVLKANKPIRLQLTEACQKLGGTRLQPIGFPSYTDFLGGIPLDAEGNAEVALIPVKGSEPLQGAGSVKLIVIDGVPRIATVTTSKSKAK